MDIMALTIHDIFYTLVQFGLDTLELNIPIYNVLAQKIDNRRRGFISMLSGLRQDAAKVITSQPNHFIESPIPFMEEIRKQPLLVEEIRKYEERNPSLINSDIGLLSFMIKNYQNYVEVTAGKKSSLIARANSDTVRTQYLEMERIKKALQENTVYQRPKPNRCKHVATLAAIRKKRDDVERFRDLTAFFKKFQGGRDKNWINCYNCNQHLLCIHERLQIQAFLQPAEKPSIDKEIIIAFSGGQFQGQSICRNCGQAIREFEFDNTVEFDDEGRPKSGNAVLVDSDEEEENDFTALISTPMKSKENELTIDLNRDKLYYTIIRELAQFMEIGFTNNQIYNILYNINNYMNAKLQSKERFEAQFKQKTGKVDPNAYQAYRARTIISICAAFFILEIQCAIPSFTKRYRYKDVIYTLDQYPLDPDNTKLHTIQYVCIAMYLRFKSKEKEFPWNSYNIFTVPAAEKDKAEGPLNKLQTIIMTAVNYVITMDMVQDCLQRKRRQRLDQTNDIVEQLPFAFLPEQTMTKEVLVPEVAAANNAKARLARTMYWIHSAHTLAKESAMIVHNSPFLETTCCRREISDPRWNVPELPDIGMRSLAPKQVNMLLTTFVPRPASNDLPEPDQELFYRLFLKCCSTNVRRGYSHEPGLTNQCLWCKFQFPENPSIMDADKEGKTALVEQGIEVTSESFAALLKQIRNLHSVKPVEVRAVQDQVAVVHEMAEIPFEGEELWSDIIHKTVELFTQLPPDTTQDDHRLAEITTPILTAIKHHGDNITDVYVSKKTKGSYYVGVMNEITKLPWNVFCDVLKTYFIIPFQRKLSNFSERSLTVPYEMEQSLSVIHVEEDLVPILARELNFFSSFQIEYRLRQTTPKQVTAANITDYIATQMKTIADKMTVFIEQITQIVAYKNKIRFRNIPVKELLLTYMQQLILLGALDTLIISDEVNNAAQSTAVLADAVMFQLDKYKAEELSFNPEILKNRIESINEKEKAKIIKELDTMKKENEDMFMIEKMKKRLGIGKWAVGGTKVIYAYDKDYYDLERQKRLDAGIIDFPGLGIDTIQQGPEVDQLGFKVEGEQDGYDHNEHGDDDFE